MAKVKIIKFNDSNFGVESIGPIDFIGVDLMFDSYVEACEFANRNNYVIVDVD